MTSRVVIDATPLLYAPAGIGRATRALIEAILPLAVSHDIEITLFGRRLLGKGLRALGLGTKTIQLRMPRKAEGLIRGARLLERLTQGDLYHATDFYLPLAEPALAVATVHDLIYLKNPEAMVDHDRLRQWAPGFAKRCQHIIAVSESTKKDIIKHLGLEADSISVIQWGLDRNIFSPIDDEPSLRERLTGLLGHDRPYFLGVSCSSGRKNTPMLLSAYSRLLANNPANDLVLAWSPPPEIITRYGASGRKGRIHFIGRQNDQALRDLYCGATAMVYPSLYEGFGLPVLEAMGCGTPVITSNTSSLPEVGGDAALYIDPHDESTLVGALESFENNPELRPGLRDKCLGQAARFSWERCANETLKVYARLLRES